MTSMNERELRRYQMFGRAHIFGRDNQADFASGSKAATAFANLARIITDLDAAKAAQQGGGNTAKEVLLDALRLDLQNVARTARAIAQDEPGFADKFRLPDGPSQTGLRTAAAATIKKLKETGILPKFTAHELPADFVKNLEDDRKAVVEAEAAETSDDSAGVASTAAIGRLIRDGMKEITTLDAIMHNKSTRNPDKLRAWKSASHVERAPQREKKPEPAAVAVTAKAA
jgi:hypothetical protein